MLSEEEKKLYKDWLPMDVELYLRHPFGRPISEEEEKHLQEIKDYISFNMIKKKVAA
jgi:hypothetical protein